jgi:Flp pilus assembly protein TadG
MTIAKWRKRLCANQSGVAALEFALSMPIVLTIITYGAEAANIAFATQTVGDITIQAADSIARLKSSVSEGDVTEALDGIKTIGGNINFAANGRIIISSVSATYVSGAVTASTIRWQRCKGALNQNSSYGVEGAALGTTGIGPTGRKIVPAEGTEIIFAEVRYTYQPLISNTLFGARTITSMAAMTVRDRTANAIVNSGTASSCSTYAA